MAIFDDIEEKNKNENVEQETSLRVCLLCKANGIYTIFLKYIYFLNLFISLLESWIKMPTKVEAKVIDPEAELSNAMRMVRIIINQAL